MRFATLFITLLGTSLSVSASAISLNVKRAANDNIVSITSASNFCMIMPRKAHTNIGDSEHPGGMQTWCSSSGRFDPSKQGKLPDNFWKTGKVALKVGKGKKGGRIAQLTGCINAASVSQLNPRDGGGQYDSSGGAGGRGNPQGSACLGYKHYVELVEPSDSRACIRCCDDPVDCPTNKDTSGCPSVISGNYFNCG